MRYLSRVRRRTVVKRMPTPLEILAALHRLSPSEKKAFVKQYHGMLNELFKEPSPWFRAFSALATTPSGQGYVVPVVVPR